MVLAAVTRVFVFVFLFAVKHVALIPYYERDLIVIKRVEEYIYIYIYVPIQGKEVKS